ncbi:uncharacterized protein KY384_002371 [Bacidia gigantensis]|uniref:uncharacterized protein n=1 Tax=Bacidia gigantensis TaxID=2732470 RepID=UPI001D042330|nr:uncharacterized protein KY384_002371 [Bacidia gigantensis]KAG8532494.1 hypothetical protein KY384_002371 [Bacidia gigantensis]
MSNMLHTVEIDRVGRRLLTITDQDVEHRVPLDSRILKIDGPQGISEYNVNDLPLKIDIGSLRGPLRIEDQNDQLIYECKYGKSRSIGLGTTRSTSSQTDPSPHDSSTNFELGKRGVQQHGSAHSDGVRNKVHSDNQVSTLEASTSTTLLPSPCHIPEIDPEIMSSPTIFNQPNQKRKFGESNVVPTPPSKWVKLLVQQRPDQEQQDDKTEVGSTTTTINSAPTETGRLNAEDWEFHRRLIATMVEMDHLEAFAKPCDYEELSRIYDKVYRMYPKVVENPMDLGTILAKIDCGEYAKVGDINEDIGLIADNAATWYWHCNRLRGTRRDIDVRNAAQSMRECYNDAIEQHYDDEDEDENSETSLGSTSQSLKRRSIPIFPGALDDGTPSVNSYAEWDTETEDDTSSSLDDSTDETDEDNDGRYPHDSTYRKSSEDS